MIEFKSYILEKLHIDKDTKVEREKKTDIKYLTELYKVGDRCLLLKDTGSRGQERIHIDVIEILKVSKTLIEFQYNTAFNTNYGGKDYIKFNLGDIKDLKKNKYAYKSGNSYTTLIVPSEDCIDVLDLIEKQKFELDFYDLLWVYKPSSPTLERVVKFKDKANKFDPSYRDYIQIDLDDLNTIRKIV